MTAFVPVQAAQHTPHEAQVAATQPTPATGPAMAVEIRDANTPTVSMVRAAELLINEDVGRRLLVGDVSQTWPEKMSLENTTNVPPAKWVSTSA